MRNNSHIFCAVLAVVATPLGANPALAQTSTAPAVAPSHQAATPATSNRSTFLTDIGSAERIHHAGSLRMLSQRISASVCNRAAGIAVADADKHIETAVRDYRRVLAGLENGDEALGIYGPESDRLILREISKLNDIWSPLNETFETVSGEAWTRDHAVDVAQSVPAMLQTSKELLGQVTAEYSDPSQMLQADAVLLQIAERQRMLEQEIANATCMIADGIDVDAAREAIGEATGLHTTSLDALRNGLPSAGVAPPPTPAIELWLANIQGRWNEVLPTLDAIAAGGDVSDADREMIYLEMNKMTWMMNETVGQYREASKLQSQLANSY